MQIVEKVVDELRLMPRLEKIYLNGYDEPTLNPRLVEIVAMLADFPARIILFTNGTNLTPDVSRQLAGTDANLEFDIHLSASTRDGYRRVHQSNLFDRVMGNLQYLAEAFPYLDRINVCIGAQMLDNDADDRLYQQLEETFRGGPLSTFRWRPNDRAGLLEAPYALRCNHNTIRGCSLDNRTSDWLHINATGNVVVCCQDYFENYIIGNVAESTIEELLRSELRRRYNDWTNGSVEGPSDYLCRRCVFAITADASK